ncbi:uncharacterized protein [Pyrus communis]|uniref:uncharacterized protein n=1 Tax=Pyrus communis TaxID=23211 RepID=UPI0035C1B119
MNELRVKGTDYQDHSEIEAAQFIKIVDVEGLEHAIAGTSRSVVGPHDDTEAVKNLAVMELDFSMFDKSTSQGVWVQASTVGSLEALLEFLKAPEVNIPGAKKFASNLGIKIFIDDVIYRLSAHFKAYINKIEEKKKEFADEAVYPCVLNILPNYVFNKKDLIAVGVKVLNSTAKVGTPSCIPERNFVSTRRIESIRETNKESVAKASEGGTGIHSM